MRALLLKSILSFVLFFLFGCAAIGGKSSTATPAAQTQQHLVGSNATPQMMASARGIFKLWYYKDCKNVTILELVALSPEGMSGKKSFAAGDKWSEKWKIDACGTIAVHTIDFELINVGGQISASLNVKPAE